MHLLSWRQGLSGQGAKTKSPAL